MPENEDQGFFNPETKDSKNKENPIDTNPQIVEDAIRVENTNISHISGPLVIFYGPREIGKTVSLLRLSSYVSGRYSMNPVQNFRDDEQYSRAIEKFELIKSNIEFAPDATGIINFLLLSVEKRNGGSFCQILEAPGEHFFDPENPSENYPPYLLRIFNADQYRKIYVFFFSVGMFGKEKINKQYAEKIAKLINTKIDSKKDRVIILCNKCDEKPSWFRNKKPIESRFRKELYENDSFKPLVNVLAEGGFKNVPFIPFSAGEFTEFESYNEKQKALTPSSDFYPKSLWNAIYKSIRGGWSFRLFG